jgi:DNA sulfur modification protein DndD
MPVEGVSMLIKRIVLEDFGLFRGRNELDLAPRTRYRHRRPVVLIGGKNGSGKTTLLDALRLALYGPMALGTRVSVREYEAFLAERIHRAGDALFQPTSAAVGIEFEYAQAGVVATYAVERRWDRTEKGVRVNLAVTRDGKPLDELDREHADDFLRDLIPPGVSQLFFFDGEKIQQLADGEHDHLALAEAVRGLIGLDHVERLRGDLRIYAGKQPDASAAGPLTAELAGYTQDKERLDARRLELVREADQSEANLDRVRQELSREEGRLAQAGGVFASRREGLIAERDQLLQAIADAEGEVRELCEGLLPFMLTGGLCGTLRSQLRAEREVTRWQIYEATLRDRLRVVKADIDAAVRSIGPPAAAEFDPDTVHDRLARLLDSLLVPPPEAIARAVRHRVTEEGRDRLLTLTGRVLEELPTQVTAVRQRLERATRRLREVEDSLAKIPAEDALKPILERLQDLHRQLGSAQSAVDRSKAAVDEVDLRLEEVARKQRRAEERLEALNKAGDRGLMVSRVQAALDDFAKQLTTAKVGELRDAVVRSFARLWRKGDLVRRIDFDPIDFRVTLFDRHDRPVPKQRLSAGEKQIYAISLLWALAQVSGRPLPVVIDTPLGRLDRDHRTHLVERYFPHASHQVVILSTDTEIDQAYFRDLAPAVSHMYHLNYDAAEARCKVEEGYFWALDGKEVAGAADGASRMVSFDRIRAFGAKRCVLDQAKRSCPSAGRVDVRGRPRGGAPVRLRETCPQPRAQCNRPSSPIALDQIASVHSC